MRIVFSLNCPHFVRPMHQCVARNGSGNGYIAHPNMSESGINMNPVRDRSANGEEPQLASPAGGANAQPPLGALFPSPRRRRTSRPRSKLSLEDSENGANAEGVAEPVVVQSPGIGSEDLPSTKRGRVDGEGHPTTTTAVSTWLRPQRDRPAFGFVSFLPTAPPVAPRHIATSSGSNSSNGDDNDGRSSQHDVDAPYWDKTAEAGADGNYARSLAPNPEQCALETAPPSFAGVGSVVVIDRYGL